MRGALVSRSQAPRMRTAMRRTSGTTAAGRPYHHKVGRIPPWSAHFTMKMSMNEQGECEAPGASPTFTTHSPISDRGIIVITEDFG